MNKKVIKNMFDRKINKEEIHNEVMIKAERKRKFSLGHIIKLSVVPICAVIAMIVSFNIKPTKSLLPEVSNNKQNIININNLDSVNEKSYALLDIALVGDVTHPSYDELVQEMPWIKNFKIPYGYDFSSMKQIYDYEDVNYKSYYLDYNNDNSNISIYFSYDSDHRPRCIHIPVDELDYSTINDTNVKLIKYSDNYYAFFEVDGLNFDIEIKNITEEEFINLIESIVR